jgi:hypothetical protein
VNQIELVSSHFGYREEYVLDHSLSWLGRKYQQALKEQFDNSSMRVIEGFKSLILLVDTAFNKGKDFEKIVPPTYEDAIKMQSNQLKASSEFVQEQWWMKTTKNAKETINNN